MTATQHPLQESSKELHTKHFYINSHFQNKPHFGGHLGGHFEFLQSLMMSGSLRVKKNIRSPYRINNKNYYIQNKYYILIDYFQNNPHVGGHFVGHLQFLKTINDVRAFSGIIFNRNTFLNKVDI